MFRIKSYYVILYIMFILINNSPLISQTFSWNQINTGLSSLEVNDLDINISDHIFVCTWWADGIFRSTNNGASWFRINSGLPEDGRGAWTLSISNSGVIFLGGVGMYRSTDNGNTWSATGLTSNLGPQTIAFDSNNHIYAGIQSATNSEIGVYKSTDNGNNWTQLNNIFYVTKIAIANNGDIFAGTYQNGIYRSSDNGNSWTLLNSSISIIRGLDFNSNGHIFVGSSGDGIFRSTDNGDSWTKTSNGLSNQNVQSIVINSNDRIFASTYGGGVFQSSDNGTSWSKVNSGLTNSNAWPLALNSSEFLFVGTYGGGVYISSQNTVSVHENSNTIPNSFILSNNYPNPFNPNTTITFGLDSDSDVSVKIFNLSGKLISTLQNNFKTKGWHSITWNGTNDSGNKVGGGIYFYQVIAGDFVQTKKMMLMK